MGVSHRQRRGSRLCQSHSAGYAVAVAADVVVVVVGTNTTTTTTEPKGAHVLARYAGLDMAVRKLQVAALHRLPAWRKIHVADEACAYVRVCVRVWVGVHCGRGGGRVSEQSPNMGRRVGRVDC